MNNKQLQAVAISAKIVELEEKNKEVFERYYQLKVEIKALQMQNKEIFQKQFDLKTELACLQNQIEPSKEINHEIH